MLVNLEEQAALRGYLPGDKLLQVLRRENCYLPSGVSDVRRLLLTVWDELTEPNWVSNLRNEYRDKTDDREFKVGDVVLVGETAWAYQPGVALCTVPVSAQQISYYEDEAELLDEEDEDELR